MAITHERVTLSQVNFEMFKFDYTDINNLNVPIITNYTSFDDVPIMNRYNVYAQMIMNGIDNMSLYDNQQNVIGSLSVDHYKIEYVTAQAYTATYLQPGEYDVDIQTSDSAYPAYQASTSSTTYIGGIQFRRVTSIVGGVPVRFKASLNGYDMLSAQDYPNIITQINDINGSWPAECVQDVLSTRGANFRPTVGLMTRTRGGVTTTYLEFVYLNNGTGFDYGAAGTWDYETLIADNLNITDYIVTEEGFMNEIRDRFSPRFWTNGIALYEVPASRNREGGEPLGDIEDILYMLQTYTISDDLSKKWVGDDQKQYIIGIRWFYGLNKASVWKDKTDTRMRLQIGTIQPIQGIAPLSEYYYNYAFTSEFANFDTSPLQVPAHFNNYLDFTCNYKLYLPYYGFLDIDPNDIVGGTIQVHYNINLYSGAATILVECTNSRTGNLATKCYTVDCTVGEAIPFTYDMYKSFGVQAAEKGAWAVKTLAGAAAGIYGAAAGKAAADANLNTEITRMTNNNLIRNEGISQAQAAAYSASGGKGMTANDFHKQFDASLTQETINTMETNQRTANQANYNNQLAQTANNIVQQNMPMSVFSPGRSSGCSDETGSMDELFPYLLITRPVNVEPADYEDYGGIPSSDSVTLNTCNGFTQIRAVHPDTMANAPKYIDEIIAQLQAGVYL